MSGDCLNLNAVRVYVNVPVRWDAEKTRLRAPTPFARTGRGGGHTAGARLLRARGGRRPGAVRFLGARTGA